MHGTAGLERKTAGQASFSEFKSGFPENSVIRKFLT
jgi:hypothetical protein